MVQFFLVLFSFLFLFSSPLHAESSVSINEFLVHPSSGNDEWIELYNPAKKDLSEYWIDDDTNFSGEEQSAKKKKIADLQADGKYIVTSPEYPYLLLSSFLNNSEGETITLFDSNGNKIAEASYTEDPGSDIAIGRVPDGTGSLQKLATATKGSQNSERIYVPTATPTKTPTPTKAPTATKVPTPTKVPTGTKAKSSAFDDNSEEAVSSSVTKVSQGESVNVADFTGVPTSVLGTSSAKKKTASKSAEKSAEQDSEKSFPYLSLFFFIIGFLFIGCAILVFLKRKKEVS